MKRQQDANEVIRMLAVAYEEEMFEIISDTGHSFYVKVISQAEYESAPGYGEEIEH